MKNYTLIRLRKQSGKTQRQVAQDIGISKSMYAMIETGRRTGSYITMKKVARYFGKTIDEIFDPYFFNQNARVTRADRKDGEGEDRDQHQAS